MLKLLQFRRNIWKSHQCLPKYKTTFFSMRPHTFRLFNHMNRECKWKTLRASFHYWPIYSSNVYYIGCSKNSLSSLPTSEATRTTRRTSSRPLGGARRELNFFCLTKGLAARWWLFIRGSNDLSIKSLVTELWQSLAQSAFFGSLFWSLGVMQ